jgi:HTH-type transcriptional regulator/antitoxin HigA
MTDVTTQRQQWMPNWSIHPGAILQEHLEARGLSQAEFARLAGISPELVRSIVSGSHPITKETAIRFERVLGLKAYVWTRMQAEWDVFQARRADTLISKPTD